MCLGIPGKVIRVNPADKLAVIEVFGVKRRVNTALLDEVALGDYLRCIPATLSRNWTWMRPRNALNCGTRFSAKKRHCHKKDSKSLDC